MGLHSGMETLMQTAVFNPLAAAIGAQLVLGTVVLICILPRQRRRR